MPKKVIIVGGGLAGIAAAVFALRRGFQPLLLEGAAQLGGRARSIYARDINCYIDNGQHVLSANFVETIALLKEIGTLERVHFQKRLSIQFRFQFRQHHLFRSWPLPAPFHFLIPLLIRLPLTGRDRRFLYRWAIESRKFSSTNLKAMTVRQWLNSIGQAAVLEMILWEPLTLATLNTPLEEASAFLLYQVMQNAFLGTSSRSGLGIPAALLSDIFGSPAGEYIRRMGGSIRLNTPVKRLVLEQGKIAALVTRQNETIETPHLILAVPPRAVTRLADQSGGLAGLLGGNFQRFQYAPIITLNLWFQRPLEGTFPMALINSPLQWIFRMPPQAADTNLYGYTAVISAATAEVDLTGARLLALSERELGRFFGREIFRELGLVKSKAVKEKSATILQTPASLKIRPATRTPLPNLFLAGDWTATDLPATIESAVLSARLAIEALENPPRQS